jgi:hypothetical protein
LERYQLKELIMYGKGKDFYLEELWGTGTIAPTDEKENTVLKYVFFPGQIMSVTL